VINVKDLKDLIHKDKVQVHKGTGERDFHVKQSSPKTHAIFALAMLHMLFIISCLFLVNSFRKNQYIFAFSKRIRFDEV